MTARKILPSRRTHEVVETEIEGHLYRIGLGRLVDGDAVAEVFISAKKPNSFLDSVASDGAILLSLLLQYGCPADAIAHSLRRDPNGMPVSPLGFAADLLLENSQTNRENEDGNSGSAEQTEIRT